MLSRIAGDKDYQTNSYKPSAGRERTGYAERHCCVRTDAGGFADSPFDHFIAGEADAISGLGQTRVELFNTKARCNFCRALTDNQRDNPLHG